MEFNKYISGAKSLIELIAVYAANRELTYENKSYLRAFQRFLSYLINFYDLKVRFEVKKPRRMKRPYVIDPINRFNNLAMNWDRHSIQLLNGYGRKTQGRLQRLVNSGDTEMDILFEEQPIHA